MGDLSISAEVLAHGIHYAVLGVGLIALLLLIGPGLLGRDPRPDAGDEHSRRVRLLGQQIASGSLGTTPTTSPQVVASRAEQPTDLRASLLLPMAIVSSAAAAAVHAAVGPEHFAESLLFGLFFACSALAQIVWAATAAFRPTRWLLELAVLGNLAAVALWALTRTVGLGPLLPTPEPVGPWDVACGVWELVTVGTARALVRAGQPPSRIPRWTRWDPRARMWASCSIVALAALSASGAGA